MLETIQIIALLQGFFVLFVLFVNRKKYRPVTFWLLFGCLLSIVLYLAGDEHNNIFIEGEDWFLFDSSLFVTFLFLFFRYFHSGRPVFKKSDALFFIPNLLYFSIELIEIQVNGEPFWVEMIEILTELTFFIYLGFIIYTILSSKKLNWTFYFAVPISLLFGILTFNDTYKIMTSRNFPIFDYTNFDTILLLIIAFLFYFIPFKLLTEQKKDILPKIEQSKYKQSKLSPELIEQYKADLTAAMEKDKMYLNNKLSIQDVAEKLAIPKQYISEVLNVYMKTNFQDFINQYRVEEFVNRLKNDRNNQFTLMGIAMESGFNSKSTFNTIFKKFKGLTPSEYKSKLK